MIGWITAIGLIGGIILIAVGRKSKIHKYLKITGIVIILVCVCLAAPSFIDGFIDGFRKGFRFYGIQ